MSLTRSVAYNTLTQLVGRIVSVALSVLIIGIVTRKLGVEGFGQLSTILAFGSLTAVFADWGILTVVARQIASRPGQSNALVKASLGLRIVSALLIYGVAWIVGYFLPYDQTIKHGLIFGLVMMFFASVNGVFLGVFQAKQRMDLASGVDLVSRLITLLITFWASRLEGGLYTFAIAYMLGNFGMLVAAGLIVRRFVRVSFSFDWLAWRPIIKEALPMGLLTFFVWVYFRVDLFILTLLRPSFDVGIYSSAYKVFEVTTIIPGLFMNALFPALTRLTTSQSVRTPRVFQKAFDVLLMAGAPAAAGLFVLSPLAIGLIGGEQFLHASAVSFLAWPVTAVLVLELLAVGLVLIFLTHAFSYTLIASGRYRAMVWPVIVITGLNIGLNFIFIPRFSYLASTLITSLTELSVLITYILLIRRELGLAVNWSKLPPVALASALMTGLLVFSLSKFGLLAALALALLGYTGVLVGFKAISRDQVLELVRFNKFRA